MQGEREAVLKKMTYATICEALIRDTLRNKLIVQDTADLSPSAKIDRKKVKKTE